MEIPLEDVIKILGAAPPEGAHVAIKVDLMETAYSKRLRQANVKQTGYPIR